MKAALKKKGIASDNFDLLIASTAIAHNMTLVTRNVKHFEQIEGIHIENWVE
jgi:predicted nucleic acid-binding protein